MKKKLIFENEQIQATIREITWESREALQRVCDAYNALGLGLITEQDLFRIPSSRAVMKEDQVAGCATCGKRITEFSSTTEYVREKLVDIAMRGEEIAVGSLRLSRARVKELVELPRKDFLDEFERAMEIWRKEPYSNPNFTVNQLSQIGFSHTRFLRIVSGKAMVAEKELDAFCETQKKYAIREGSIVLHNKLEQLAELINEVNATLPKYGLKTIEINADPSDGNVAIYHQQGLRDYRLNGLAVLPNHRLYHKLP